MNELLALMALRFSQTKEAISGSSWGDFTQALGHMGPVEWIGWTVTALFLTYHAIKNQRTRLIVAKICSVVTVFYFFLRGDLPMLTKWLFVMGINVYMWKALKTHDPDELVDN